MIGLALKMLFGDTAKYLMLVAGLFFATFLIVQQASVFCGLMRWTTATLKNVAAPIWVVEERVEQVNETNPMRDTDVARVRSVSAVRWAMPLYSGIQRVRLERRQLQDRATHRHRCRLPRRGARPDGRGKSRRPPPAQHRRHRRTRHPAAFLRSGRSSKRIKIGDQFEINDIEARVVGICEGDALLHRRPLHLDHLRARPAIHPAVAKNAHRRDRGPRRRHDQRRGRRRDRRSHRAPRLRKPRFRRQLPRTSTPPPSGGM